MKESAWALTNLSNPFQRRAAFARPLLLQDLREREAFCLCGSVCAYSRSRAKELGVGRDGSTSLHAAAAVEAFALSVLAAWSQRPRTESSGDNWTLSQLPRAFIMLHVLSKADDSAVHLGECNCIERSGGGVYLTPSVGCSARVSERVYESLILLYGGARHRPRLRLIADVLSEPSGATTERHLVPIMFL